MSGAVTACIRSVCALAAVAAAAWAAPAAGRDYPLEPPRLASNDPFAQKAWADRYLDQNDWILVGYANRDFWLITAEETPHNRYPVVEDWARAEDGQMHPPGSKVALSELWRIETDCAKQTYRVIRTIGYKYNNLRGPVLFDTQTPDAPYVTAAAGSVNESLVNAVCSAAKETAPPQGPAQ